MSFLTKCHLDNNIMNTLQLLFRKLSLLLLFAFVTVMVQAQIPARPSPPRLVNDFAGILSGKQANQLEHKLVAFNDSTSNQITVVIVKSLKGNDKAMFAYEIGEKWKVGRKKFDNGVVVLVKPKYGDRDRGEVYIAVGYGLEPAIPDATTKRIVDNEMIPDFKRGDYYGGIDNAVDVLMKLAAGEINSDEYNKQVGGNSIFAVIPFIIIILVFILIRISGSRSHSIGTRGSGSFWTALWLGSAMSNSSRSGSWNSFSGGGSGFGGGGGFGGFGGGSFGGGGAGGSW